jgi:acyl-coenzyme A synthetase/AMP-(fatty) acid ligase
VFSIWRWSYCHPLGWTADARQRYTVIDKYKPTLLFSVPTNYGMLLAHEPSETDFDLSSVRQAVSAGEALPPALFERFRRRFGVEILDGVGSTEILHIFISNRPGAIRQDRPGRSGLRQAGRRGSRFRSVTSHTPGQGRFDVRSLLEQAREDQGNDSGRVDPHGGQISSG